MHTANCTQQVYQSMHTNTWNLDRFVCDRQEVILCFHCPNLCLMDWLYSHMILTKSVCCIQSYMHILWRLAPCCTVDFPPNNCYKYIPSSWLLYLMLTCSLLPSSARLLRVKYVSRSCGGHGELHVRFYDVTTWSYVDRLGGISLWPNSEWHVKPTLAGNALWLLEGVAWSWTV